MEKEIKDLRLHIDGLAQLITNIEDSDEVLACKDSLFFSKAWLGKCLGALGTPSPYPKDGERKSVADIEPTADTVSHDVTKTATGWEEKNNIEKIDWLRQEIGNILKEDYLISDAYRPVSRTEAIARTNAYTELCEARFWLGFALEAIKKEHEK